jgi:LysR family glycine cleavage system transcriptional activator
MTQQRDDWRLWLTAAGAKGVDPSRGPVFDHAMTVLQAAMDGLGVALGRNPLITPDLKAGRLVVPFEFKMATEFAYYVVYPPDTIRRRKIKAFRDWLMPLAEIGPKVG